MGQNSPDFQKAESTGLFFKAKLFWGILKLLPLFIFGK
jgi:hypothetical protein